MKTRCWVFVLLICGCHYFGARLHAQSLAVMTYNLRVDLPSDGDDAWPNRRERLVEVMAAAAPDLLGVQEALPAQLSYLKSALRGYDYVGVGRLGAEGGEHTALFYKVSRVEVLQSSTFWLSRTPDTVSIDWGAAYPRIATWARLRTRDSGEELLVVNTHLDHKSSEAQREGLALLTRTIDSLAEPGLPVILMGDFNMTSDRSAIRQLRDDYVDAYRGADNRRTGPTGTLAGFDGRNLVRNTALTTFSPVGSPAPTLATTASWAHSVTAGGTPPTISPWWRN